MLKIRLARYGKRNSPFYRIVVALSSLKREGRELDRVGSWDPQKDILEIDKEKLDMWKKKGAQATRTVLKLFAKSK